MTIPIYTVRQAPKLTAKIALTILNLLGWKLRFDGFPGAHGVVIFYPHTSNWDFFFGILAKWAIGCPLKFLAKESLFKGVNRYLAGPVLRFWGGEGIERGSSSGAIARLAARIQQADWFWLAIAPEGTRSYTPHIRSGFYHIALGAKVPLVCAFIDFNKKEIGLSQTLELSGDEAADLAQIRAVYQQYTGKYPQNHSEIVFRH